MSRGAVLAALLLVRDVDREGPADMRAVRRWAGQVAIVLAACPLTASPVTAAPLDAPVVVTGPGVSGFFLSFRPRPRESAANAFVAQPVGPSLLRLVVDVCERTCLFDDSTVPGSMVWTTPTDVVIRATHPKLGTIVLAGRSASVQVGTYARCELVWPGTLSSITATAADFHRVTWSGRIGAFSVRALAGDPCSYAHLAGLLVAS